MKLSDISKMINVDYWRVLLEIKKRENLTKTTVAKFVDVSYVQCFLILRKLKAMDLTIETKKGKQCYLQLSDKGVGVCKMVDILRGIKCKK